MAVFPRSTGKSTGAEGLLPMPVHSWSWRRFRNAMSSAAQSKMASTRALLPYCSGRRREGTASGVIVQSPSWIRDAPAFTA